MSNEKPILIYDNHARLALSAALKALADYLREQGHKVVFLNPNPYSPECFEAGAGKVVIVSCGQKAREISDAYNLAGIPALIISSAPAGKTPAEFWRMLFGPPAAPPEKPETEVLSGKTAPAAKAPRRKPRRKGK